MKEKVLIVGHFGFESNKIDGQTIKTRNVYQLLSTVCDTHFFDTDCFTVSKFNVFTLLWLVFKYKKIFYLGAQRNLKYFFPFLYLISKVRCSEVVYITIGGWLYNFLKVNHPVYKYMIRNIKFVLVETEFLKLNLREIGVSKVGWIPNFRMPQNIKNSVGVRSDDDFKVVFMARVIKEKGVFLLLDFFKSYLDDKSVFNKNVILDFYGPISDTDAKRFQEEISQLGLGVRYRGILDPSEIYHILPDYDLLVLPTYYEGEGFPGTILDAYLCGLPVIATRWKQIPEFVEDSKTGFLISYDVEQLSSKIQHLVNDADLLYIMKENAYLKSKEYSSAVGLRVLQEAMEFN